MVDRSVVLTLPSVQVFFGFIFAVVFPVFLVIAETHLAARKAARLGKISYTERPALLTVDDALAANSRFEQGPVIWAKGDAARAIAAAPHQIEGSFEVGGQEHFYLEGHIAAAIPLEDGMHVLSSTQHPSEIQHKVAHALHLNMADVRVETRRMGGGDRVVRGDRDFHRSCRAHRRGGRGAGKNESAGEHQIDSHGPR